MASTPPPVPPAPPAAPATVAPSKKTSPWVWVAVGCGGLLLIVTLVFVLAGLWVFKKGKEFVHTAEKNPAVAAAKLIVAANPELELVEADENAGTVTIRNKKTGETVTLDAKEVRKGKLSFRTEKGEELRFEGSKQEGSFKISSKGGELTFGANQSLPSWVPLPAGAKPAGAFAASGKGEEHGWASFESQESPADLLRFYETALKGTGFSPSVSRFEHNGKVVGGLVGGQHADGRKLSVTVTSEKGKTTVVVGYERGRSQ